MSKHDKQVYNGKYKERIKAQYVKDSLQQVTLTKEHIKLMKLLYTKWEYGNFCYEMDYLRAVKLHTSLRTQYQMNKLNSVKVNNEVKTDIMMSHFKLLLAYEGIFRYTQV